MPESSIRTGILFDMDGLESCLAGNSAKRIFDSCVSRIRSLGLNPAVVTNVPEISELALSRRIPLLPVPEGDCRSENEKLRLVTKIPAALWWSLHYPSLSNDMILEALSSPGFVVSVVRERLAVHRFYTFRLRGRSGKPEGDVVLSRWVESGKVIKQATNEPGSAPEPSDDIIREWGDLCPAEDADARGYFEIPDLWRFDARKGQWQNTRTQSMVCGRKEFPEAFRLADAFAAGNPTEVTRPIEITGDASRRLDTIIDLLRERFLAGSSSQNRGRVCDKTL